MTKLDYILVSNILEKHKRKMISNILISKDTLAWIVADSKYTEHMLWFSIITFSHTVSEGNTLDVDRHRVGPIAGLQPRVHAPLSRCWCKGLF